MKRDAHKTPVIFRKFRGDQSIIALFPTLPGTNDPHTCESYMHVGQHSAAGTHIAEATSTLATPNEYADLHAELTGLGYNLQIRKRFTRKDFSLRVKQLSV